MPANPPAGRHRRDALRLIGAGGLGGVTATIASASASPAAAAAGTNRGGSVTVVASDAGSTFTGNGDFQCDGTADEVQINAAIAALGSRGGTLALSGGTFRIGAPVVLAPNVRIVGQGDEATVVLRTADVVMVRASGSGQGGELKHAGLEDLSLRGADLGATLLEAHYAAECHFRRVNLASANGWAVDGVQFWDSMFLDCRFDWCGVAGASPKTAVSVVSSRPDVPSTDNSNNVAFVNCAWESCKYGELELRGANADQRVNKCYLVNCKLETLNLSGPMIRLMWTAFISMVGCNVTTIGRATELSGSTDLVTVGESYMVAVSHFYGETVVAGLVRSFLRLTGGNDDVSLRAVYFGGPSASAAVGAIDIGGSNARVLIDPDVGWWYNPSNAPEVTGRATLTRRFRSSGVVTCAVSSSGATTSVTHNLASTPLLADIEISPVGDVGATRYWVSAVSATTFTITRIGSSSANVSFSWRATIAN